MADRHADFMLRFRFVEIPAEVKAEFTTSVVDLGLGGFDFEIETCCLVCRNGMAATAVVKDTTVNPVFTKMLDRWARSPGPEWLARHIIDVQRGLALELALRNLDL